MHRVEIRCLSQMFQRLVRMSLEAGMGKSYRELVAWQKAMLLVTQIYRATKTFPVEERYGLTNQLRRAAVSVPSNIAEGQGRFSSRDFHRFLGTARGSLVEIETQVEIAKNLGLPELRTDCGTTAIDSRTRLSVERTAYFDQDGWLTLAVFSIESHRLLLITHAPQLRTGH
jgi:four helix bundle protein